MTAIESPCRKVCRLNRAGTVCTACGRTLTQIRDWSVYSPETRREIMARLAAPSPNALTPDDERPGDGQKQ